MQGDTEMDKTELLIPFPYPQPISIAQEAPDDEQNVVHYLKVEHTTPMKDEKDSGVIIISRPPIDGLQLTESQSDAVLAVTLPSRDKGKVRDQKRQQVRSNAVFLISALISLTFSALAPFFIPLNFNTLVTFIAISGDKQPLFLLFAAVHLICLLDTLVALIEGIVLWTEINRAGCEVLGITHVTIFFSLSLFLSTICMYRITAVLKPRRYKEFAKRRLVMRIIAGIMAFSILVSSLLVVTGTIRFKYTGRPQSIGCSLFVVSEMVQLFASLLILTTLFVNLILASTYCVLYRYFRYPVPMTQDVRTMKSGALFVTSLTTGLYFICYFPAVVVNIFLIVDPETVTGLLAPFRLLLDFALVFLPHLYSCILPLCLVTGTTLKRVGTAARATRKSVMMVNRTAMQG